jgi:dTDP-glucose 4,6-dehydratase
MKLLVTGGAGFIGSNFIHYWFDKYPKDKIINLDKLTYAGNPDNLVDIENKFDYKFIKGDICNGNLVCQLVEDIDIIIHFAAETHVDRSILSSSEFVKTNILGTHVLLKAALKRNIRFHHVSTDEVFGALELNDKKKFNELTPYNPRSPYAASKASSDHLVRSFYYTYNLPITISNCSNNYGPYQHLEKLIPLTITNLIEGKKVPVYGDGLYVRDWLHVDDHCNALELIIQKGKIGNTYCIGGTLEDISNLQIIKIILKYFNKDDTSLRFIEDRPGHDRKYAIDWTKIRQEMGWQPKNTLEVWLEKTIKWYLNNERWWKKVKKDKFNDYYSKKYNNI